MIAPGENVGVGIGGFGVGNGVGVTVEMGAGVGVLLGIEVGHTLGATGVSVDCKVPSCPPDERSSLSEQATRNSTDKASKKILSAVPCNMAHPGFVRVLTSYGCDR
ncbi:hypothetical protein M1N23_03135 [Dehalococcoidia bacterium]|nr:hypothetical protein [Dehalococcoidia bacterium]